MQLTRPSNHAAMIGWPLEIPLEEWSFDGIHGVLGLHRHEVRMIEQPSGTYVVKELPDHLARREFRMLRFLAEANVPTVESVAVVTDRRSGEGLIVTQHLDYSLPYRVLLSGRGLQIPALGERLIDALVGLLARLHLAGVYWGDCSLSNTLFRRDAGALAAYAIDMETAEHHEQLSDGQRQLDIDRTTENVAGDLFDLQLGGRLVESVEPLQIAWAIEHRYRRLWSELTETTEFPVDETFRVGERIERLHALGYDIAELEVVSTPDGQRMQMIPTVVEPGWSMQRLAALTGLHAEENQARRLLADITQFGATMRIEGTAKMPEGMVATRWFEQRFAPTVALIPDSQRGTLEPAELYHHLLEHRWFLSERAGRDVGIADAAESFTRDVLPQVIADGV